MQDCKKSLQQPRIHYVLGTLTMTDWPPVADAIGPKDALLSLHHQQVQPSNHPKASCYVEHTLQGYLNTIWVRVLPDFAYEVSFFGFAFV